MLRNMWVSLLKHEAIKPRYLRQRASPRVEPLITLEQRGPHWPSSLGVRSFRVVTSLTKLFNELGPRYKARPGGYTRILKMGFRVGEQRLSLS